MASYILTRTLLDRITNKNSSVIVTSKIKSQLTSKDSRPGIFTPQIVTSNTKFKPSSECAAETKSSKVQVCRTCRASACIPLLSSLGDGDIMSALRSVTKLCIKVDDKLPQYICNSCLQLLRSAFDFQRQCQDVDRQLRYTSSGMPFASPHPLLKHDFKMILDSMKVKRVQQEKKNGKKKKIKIMRNKQTEKKTKETAHHTKCQPCNLSFPTKEQLVRHRRLQRCMRRACHVCGQLVLSVQQHVRHAHAAHAAHTCLLCGKQFPIAARLRSHQLTHEDTFSFHCAHCSYKSKHKYYLVLHMRTHTGEKPYSCATCGAAFVNPSNLNKHRLTHSDKQFACPMCDKLFRTSSALREHYDAAHAHVKHTCTYCGQDFRYKSDLRKHEIRTHNRRKRDYIGGEPTYKKVERMQHASTDFRRDSFDASRDVNNGENNINHNINYANNNQEFARHNENYLKDGQNDLNRNINNDSDIGNNETDIKDAHCDTTNNQNYIKLNEPESTALKVNIKRDVKDILSEKEGDTTGQQYWLEAADPLASTRPSDTPAMLAPLAGWLPPDMSRLTLAQLLAQPHQPPINSQQQDTASHPAAPAFTVVPELINKELAEPQLEKENYTICATSASNIFYT